MHVKHPNLNGRQTADIGPQRVQVSSGWLGRGNYLCEAGGAIASRCSSAIEDLDFRSTNEQPGL